MIPIPKGSERCECQVNFQGLETHENDVEVQLWHRRVFHTVIESVLAPIQQIMSTGEVMFCADHAQRLCFPILCQYIGDMEEQWLLTCMVRQHCPKCYHHHEIQRNSKFTQQIASTRRLPQRRHPPPNSKRTDLDAQQCRKAYRSQPNNAVAPQLLGYHRDAPFSRLYPLGGTIDAVGPDLLHQISKCFMDYLIKSWIWKLIEITWKGKASLDQVKLEFDARFAVMPKYTNLQRFNDGIMAEKHYWTVHEYKQMMKTIVGTLMGLCPPQGIFLIREYLHIHRLSHYAVHTDESLEWLRDSIKTFFQCLRNPTGPFIKNGLVQPDYEPQRLHYFFHYADTVIAKGALPSYSTDRTEIYHKAYKNAFQRSNKVEGQSLKFILSEQTTLSAFQNMVDNFDSMAPRRGDEMQSENSGLKATEDHPDDDLELDRLEDLEPVVKLNPAQIGLTTFTWPKHPQRSRSGRASVIEKSLFLNGFHRSVNQYFRARLASTNNIQSNVHEVAFDPELDVFNSIRISYPSWFPDEVGVDVVFLSDADRKRAKELIEPSPPAMITERINANPNRRYDVVLVRSPERGSRLPGLMSKRQVAQILLLLKLRNQLDGTEENLAYVSWFETKRKDDTSGLYLVARKTTTAVIDIIKVERPVHLIPKFGSDIGVTAEVKRDLDRVASNRRMAQSNTPLSNKAVDAMSHYQEFWLNTWIDSDMYKRIF